MQTLMRRGLDVFCKVFRTCLHKKCVRIFEHNFVADKAKIRRWAVALQGFLTQSAAKFAEKTCAYACEDRFLCFSKTSCFSLGFYVCSELKTQSSFSKTRRMFYGNIGMY